MSQSTEKPLSLDMGFDQALGRFLKVNTKELQEDFTDNKASPFVKWVGGKRSIINELITRLPKEFNDYYEPFVGGGALFFEMKNFLKDSKKYFISDLNLDLILSYKVIKENLSELIEILRKYERKHKKQEKDEFYYKIRNKHEVEEPIKKVARFLYLNRTCYNGLFRTNKKGEFNVPMGKYKNPTIVNEKNLLLCSKALKNTSIKLLSFDDIKPKKGDFVYFDPPYHPTTKSSFTQYTALNFTEKDQLKLRDFIVSLHKRGVFVMLSNSNTEFIKKIYKLKGFKIELVEAPRNVNCKADKRKSTKEVLITNY